MSLDTFQPLKSATISVPATPHIIPPTPALLSSTGVFPRIIKPAERELRQAAYADARQSCNQNKANADAGLGIGFDERFSTLDGLRSSAKDIKSIWKSLSSRLSKGMDGDAPAIGQGRLTGRERRNISSPPHEASGCRLSTSSNQSTRSLPARSGTALDVVTVSSGRDSVVHNLLSHTMGEAMASDTWAVAAETIQMGQHEQALWLAAERLVQDYPARS